MADLDAARTPVVVGVGQAIERSEIVSATEMAARAARAAFEDAPGLRERIQRVTMISVIFSPSSKAPATEVAQKLQHQGVD